MANNNFLKTMQAQGKSVEPERKMRKDSFENIHSDSSELFGLPEEEDSDPDPEEEILTEDLSMEDYGESKNEEESPQIDLDLDHLPDLGLKEEKQELKESVPPIPRRRGRPKMTETPPEEEVKEIAPEKKEVVPQKEEPKKEWENHEEKSPQEVYREIFLYVCNKTVQELSKKYKSDIYTPEFTKKLFDSYLEGDMPEETACLFYKLIEECETKNVVDPLFGR